MADLAPARRRVTAASRLVLPADAPEQDWLAARREGIGSSDVPRILGIYPSPLRVWHDKHGNLPDEDRDSTEQRAVTMRMGRRWESGIADEWTMRNRAVTRRVGLVENVERPYLKATVDRRVVECPEGGRNRCLLECKLTSVFRAERWRRQVPDDVLAQTLHQIRVTGDDHAHVAVMIGTQDYRQFTVRADDEPDAAAVVASDVDDFYERYIRLGIAPDAMAEENLDDALYELLHPTRDGIARLDMEQSLQAYDLIAQYRAASAARGESERARKDARTAIIAMLGENETAVDGNGDFLFAFREVNSAPGVDLDRMHEHHRAAYDDCVTPKTTRKLDIRKGR